MARILIIEDERAILTLLHRIATHMGHSTATASNGAEALEQFDTFDPQLIISDLKMPGTPSGVDLIRALHKRNPQVPILVISGYASREFMTRWPDLGIDEFVPKPFRMDTIRDAICRLLDKAETPDAATTP